MTARDTSKRSRRLSAAPKLMHKVDSRVAYLDTTRARTDVNGEGINIGFTCLCVSSEEEGGPEEAVARGLCNRDTYLEEC